MLIDVVAAADGADLHLRQHDSSEPGDRGQLDSGVRRRLPFSQTRPVHRSNVRVQPRRGRSPQCRRGCR